MYEPSHFKVEDRAALHAVMRAHPLAMLAAADKLGVLNGLNVKLESETQAMVSLVKTYGFGHSA